jgi:Tol biopolymer transport system component
MPGVLRYAGGFYAVATALALAGAAAAAAAPTPDGPGLAFNAVSTLKPSGFTVRTMGLESPRPLVFVRGSRGGVVPRPLDGVAWSIDGSLLAFTGAKGSRRGIYVARPNGTGLHFVRGTEGGSDPVFSPDGRKIAFSREHPGKGLFFSTTPWVARVNGSRARRLAEWRDGVDYVPTSFSPDGAALAVTRSKVFGPDKPKALLFGLDGSGHVQPLARFPASDPVFAPDGSRIALVRHSASRRRGIETIHKDLYLVNTDGTVLSRLTNTRWVAETHPSWDPSGGRIAFNSFRISRDPFGAIFDELLPFGNSIVQINADGTCREKLLSLQGAAVYGVQWRPGPGREAGPIECGAPAVGAPGPEGPRLAVVRFSLPLFRFDLETVDETGAQPLRLAGGGEWKRPLPEWFTAPAWSPDGSAIVFAGVARSFFDGPRGTRLYVSGADGSGLRPLRGTHGADEPVFAPDGTAVAFTRVHFQPRRNRRGERKFVARGASVWLVNLAGGRPTRITPVRKGLTLYAKSFSPDGSTLLASRAVGRRPWEVVQIELATGRTEVLLRHAVDPVYSPDGARIAFVRWHPLERRGDNVTEAASLFTIKAGGGGLRQLTSARGNDFFPSWDPSGKRLAFVRYRPEVTELDELGMGSALMQVNADGSCLRTVLRPSRETGLYGAAWQPGPGREAGRLSC